MIPVKNADGDWTVVVKILADIISGYIGGFLPLLCVLILTVSAVMSLIALAKPKFIMNSDIMKECFACKPIWVVLRVLAVIFVWLTYLGVGEDGVGLIGMITGGGQGGFVLYDLLTTLVIIFVIAALLLPLLAGALFHTIFAGGDYELKGWGVLKNLWTAGLALKAGGAGAAAHSGQAPPPLRSGDNAAVRQAALCRQGRQILTTGEWKGETSLSLIHI